MTYAIVSYGPLKGLKLPPGTVTVTALNDTGDPIGQWSISEYAEVRDVMTDELAGLILESEEIDVTACPHGVPWLHAHCCPVRS